MVGAAGEQRAVELGRGEHGGGQVGLGVEKQCGVEEAGFAAGGQVQALAVGKVDELQALAAQSHSLRGFGDDLEAKCLLVVAAHVLHVADLEHHGAHGEVCGELVLGAGFCSHVIAPVLRRPPTCR